MIGKPNPRGKKLDKPGGAGPRFGSPLAYVLLVLVAFLLLRTLFQDAGFQRVPYSRLLDRIQSDGCAKVVLSQDWVKCYPKGAEGSGSRGELPWFAVRVQGDAKLIPLLESKRIEYEAVAESSTTDMIWMLAVPIGLGLLFVSWLTRRMSGGMPGGPPGVMSFGKTKARIYMEATTGVTFKDVAGIDEAVDELKEIVEFLKTPAKFRRLGGRTPKGVLLLGPPGTGKTLLARAVAGEAGVPFFSLSGSEFVEMFVGVGAARVRDLFQQAASKAPSIIFIDELDAIGKSRNAGVFGGHDEREQTLNQMLAEMDGLRLPHRAHRAGGYEPAGDPRSRAHAAGAFRPAGAGRPARPQGARGYTSYTRPGSEAGTRRRPAPGRRAHAGVRRRRPGQRGQRGGAPGRA